MHACRAQATWMPCVNNDRGSLRSHPRCLFCSRFGTCAACSAAASVAPALLVRQPRRGLAAGDQAPGHSGRRRSCSEGCADPQACGEQEPRQPPMSVRGKDHDILIFCFFRDHGLGSSAARQRVSGDAGACRGSRAPHRACLRECASTPNGWGRSGAPWRVLGCWRRRELSSSARVAPARALGIRMRPAGEHARSRCRPTASAQRSMSGVLSALPHAGEGRAAVRGCARLCSEGERRVSCGIARALCGEQTGGPGPASAEDGCMLLGKTCIVGRSRPLRRADMIPLLRAPVGCRVGRRGR